MNFNRICIVLLIVLVSQNVYSIQKEFIGKIGTSYANKLDNAGLDISVNYVYDFDPYFVAGFEGSFFWLPWEKTLGYDRTGEITKRIVANSNTYSFPLFFNAQVRLPFLVEKIYVKPFFNIGIGYTGMILTYDSPEINDGTEIYPEESVTDFYHGFSWQLLAGVNFKPAPSSNIEFTGEFGYRSINTKKSNQSVDLSGLLLRFGVIFKI